VTHSRTCNDQSAKRGRLLVYGGALYDDLLLGPLLLLVSPRASGMSGSLRCEGIEGFVSTLGLLVGVGNWIK
jgi:hypothetical protein